MKLLIVVENPKRWRFSMPGVDVISARAYLVDPFYAKLRRATIYNLCRTYSYQGLGYYVSLLAAARSHRPLPSVATIQSLRIAPIIRIVGEELDAVIQQCLRPLKAPAFKLSIYFGRNLTGRYDRLARAVFNQFPAPFLRAEFLRDRANVWRLETVRLISAGEVPDAHVEFVTTEARRFFESRIEAAPQRRAYRYDLAILWRADDPNPPSDQRAIHKFVKAAQQLGIRADIVGADDYGRIAEYDGLFIRETTGVDHYTFRFARRAAAEGLPVIDDPESIIRCTNKVYQTELFERIGIPSPKTVVVHDGNRSEALDHVGLPCVLKLPDSAFSQGVVRIETVDEMDRCLDEFLEHSDLAIAQEFVHTDFDWRVGILDGVPLFCAKYHMARGHWQIIRNDRTRDRFGKVEALALDTVPPAVLEIATQTAAHAGSGFYGVDVKQTGDRLLVTEINDNPNVDAGYEDAVLGPELYRAVMRWFLHRFERRGDDGERP